MISPNTIYLIERYMENRLDEVEADDLWRALSESEESRHYFRKQVFAECLLRASSTLNELEFLDETTFNAGRLRLARQEERSEIPLPSIDRLLELDALILARSEVDDTTSYEKFEAWKMDELARKAAEAATDGEDPLASTRLRGYDNRANRQLLPLSILLPSILVVFGIMVFFEWNPLHKEPPREETISQPRSFPSTPAVMTDCDNVVWSNGGMTPKPGEPIPPGLLRFESGSVELLFFNGVRGVVEGPADLVLLNEKQVFCKKGNWSVTVPPQGSGFEIQTPHWTVRDIGTRFFTAIDTESCDLHVLNGTVEMEKPDSEKMLFKTDQAAKFLRTRFVKRIPVEAERFVTRQEMRRRSKPFWTGIEMRTQLPGDTATKPIRDVDFRTGSVADALLHGGTRVEGSNPESKAFRHILNTDRVRLKPAGETTAMTVVLWIKIDRLNSEFNPIMMSEGSPQNGLVWHITPQGKILAGLRFRSAQSSGIFESPALFTEEYLGRFVQLALVVDGSTRDLTILMDGDTVLAGKLPRSVRINLNAVDIGGWVPQIGNASRNQMINGAIERVLLFDRALKRNEIRNLADTF